MPLSGPSGKEKNATPLVIPTNIAEHKPVKMIKPSNRDYDILSNQIVGMKINSENAPVSSS